jgi:hypothetical protein
MVRVKILQFVSDYKVVRNFGSQDTRYKQLDMSKFTFETKYDLKFRRSQKLFGNNPTCSRTISNFFLGGAGDIGKGKVIPVLN